MSTRLQDHPLVHLKFYRQSNQQLKHLRKKLGVTSAADVLHILITQYELPEPRPKALPVAATELGTKEVYAPDHKQLRLLKYALGFDSYAEVIVELLRYYPLAPSPILPAIKQEIRQAPPADETGEELFERILAMLERKRKQKRADAKAARETT